MADHTANLLEFLPLPESPTGNVEYRVLTSEEVASISGIFSDSNAPMPNPASSFFVGAVDATGAVIGFIVIQSCIHAQPMWVHPSHKTIFSALTAHAEKEIADRIPGELVVVYTFTPAGPISRLAQLSGMQIEPWVVHSKLVAGVQVDTQPNPQPADSDSESTPVPEPVPELVN